MATKKKKFTQRRKPRISCANPCGSVARVKRELQNHKDNPKLLPKKVGETEAAYAKRVLKKTATGGCMAKIQGSSSMKGNLKGKPGNRFIKSAC